MVIHYGNYLISRYGRIKMARVLLVVPQHNGDSNLRPGGQVTAANGLRDQLKEMGYSIDVVNVIPPNFASASVVSKALSSVLRMIRVTKMLLTNRYDFAILFTGSLFNFPERLLMVAFARLRGVRTALFFRNSSVLGISVGSFRGHLFAQLFKIPNFLLVQGEEWKELFLGFGLSPYRISVVPNWLPSDINIASKPCSVKSGDKLRFVFVGRLTEEKGVIDLVNAAKRLADRVDFEITLAGDGDAVDRLNHLLSDCDPGKIKLLGWQSRKAVAELLCNSHIFVLPTYHPEGFPNSILEAMASGLPIIASDVGAISESVHDGVNGYLIAPRSCSELVTAMRRYLDNPALVTEHSLDALRVVRERHDRSKNCKNVVDFLRGEG